MLDAAAIAHLRAMLGPRPDRYDFATVVQRWASEVLGDPPASELTPEGPAGWENEFIAQITTGAPEKPEKSFRKRRPRADHERYAALLLAVIFHEFTGLRPGRTWKTGSKTGEDTDKNSRFYEFASEGFRAIGLEPSWKAYREATERWDKSRDFSKRAIGRLLWGGLGRDA